jgi:hypothetical protein
MSRSIARVVYAAFLVLFFAGCGEEPVVTVPDLDSIPTGLNVTYSPPLVEAQQGGRSGYRYTWSYSTSVSATGAPVTIEEFGALGWVNGEWVFRDQERKTFSPKMFAEQYDCSKAKVLSGKTYTCKDNWSGADKLRPYRCKWYFIGTDERGRRVKGEAIIEELPRLKKG